MKIIDMHTHAQNILFVGETKVSPSLGVLIRLFEWRRFNRYNPRSGKMEDRMYHLLRKRVVCEIQARNAMANAASLTREMERAQITHSIILPIEPYGNTAEVISFAKNDKRLVPFASVDPRDPQRTEKLRTYAKAGCRGLKLHPIIQDFHPASRECFETVEEFKQYGLPILFHSGRTSYYMPESESENYARPENFIKLFAAFPDVKFIMGHMAMFDAKGAIEIAQVFKNVYLETSFQPVRMVKRAIDKVGGDRVLFGTDWPFGRQRFELSVILSLTKGNEWLKERLLWKNAEELIGPV